jgi:hypothetical protein
MDYKGNTYIKINWYIKKKTMCNLSLFGSIILVFLLLYIMLDKIFFIQQFHVVKTCIKVVPYTSCKIWSARLIFLFFWAVCLNISTVINIKILTNSNQQTQSYKFTSHIHVAAFLSVVLITEMLEICIQTLYDQNIQLILKSYLPVVYGTPLIHG